MAREWLREEYENPVWAESRANWWRVVRRRSARIEILRPAGAAAPVWVVIVYAGEVFQQKEALDGP